MLGVRLAKKPFAWVLLLQASLFPPAAAAQSITAGVLHGVVRDADGDPLPDAAVTIEDQSGGAVRELTSGDNGDFLARMLSPGGYNILVEMVGYQPVRIRGVIVAAGRTTMITVKLERRPPPVSTVTDIHNPGASSGASGRVVSDRDLRTLDHRVDATDVSRGVSQVAAPVDGRSGFAVAASGLPGSFTRFFADGVPELLLRHPGVPGEPATAAAFPREGVSQGQISNAGLDTEWRGNPGSILNLVTQSGTNRLRFRPYVLLSSAKAGGNSSSNPGDSSGTSMWVGGSIGGSIRRDTANFFLSGNYQSLATPSPFPWEEDGGGIRDAVQTIAQDRYGTSIASAVAPVVRTWKGGSGLGRADWRVSGNTQLMLRASAASFKEANPLLGVDVGLDHGASMTGRDLSVALSLSRAGTLANELRVGAAMARRDWRAASLPGTRLVHEGVRFGGNPALRGLFEARLLSLSNAVQYQSGAHAFKAGASADLHSYRQQYQYGSTGQYLFGDLEHFNTGQAYFSRTFATLSEVKLGAPLVGVFLQDTWQVVPGFDVLLGVRYETQLLPKNKIVRNTAWSTAVGVLNDSVSQDRRGIQPRLGFVLDPAVAGGWLVQGGVGLYAAGLDLATFAEVAHHSGSNVKAARGTGSFSTWPGVPDPGPSLEANTRLTMFAGGPGYRAPRTLKGDLAITRAGAGLTLQIGGGYHHTDFLLRRSDLNLLASPSGTTQEGRPVYGNLRQQGGLVFVELGSSRKFADFELVSALLPTGFSDHYEVTTSVTGRAGRSLALTAEYVFSRTRDNLVGLLQPDPADQLSPFPGTLDGANWDESRSDLDIPHRIALSAHWTSRGRYPVSVMARGRWRSGLPFTPGFRPGVDVNGDLGGNNDPAPSDAVASPSGPGAVASCDGSSVGGFAARNTCRERGFGSLDLRLSVPLPIGNPDWNPVALTLEAFNLVASSTGVVDRAAVLIDPASSLTTNSATGVVTLPFITNPRFGTLLRRGGEPRVVRIGLRMGVMP